jgi:hypothetical protein
MSTPMSIIQKLREYISIKSNHGRRLSAFMQAKKISRKRFKPGFDIFSAQAGYLAGVSEVRKGDLQAAEAWSKSLPSSGKTVIVPIPLGDFRSS